jgi:hypothetical protein
MPTFIAPDSQVLNVEASSIYASPDALDPERTPSPSSRS